MSYTDVGKVAGMFPTFARGGANQKPSDALIQQYLDDVTAEINAVLDRRFAESIAAPPSSGSVSAWLVALGTDASNILEKINRFGGAAQLGETLATLGITGVRDMAKGFADAYREMLNDLDARDANGKPLASGRYDHLFDPSARTETPRPGLQAIAGGDQPEGQTPRDTGSSQVFGKFDKRGT
ncbi:MAG: hypothetical protein DMG24_14640 [Acidobacteria bacterium]|nr:MAG: hypothetical protein DMG24_14640 [Acidobacteriota bacterium]